MKPEVGVMTPTNDMFTVRLTNGRSKLDCFSNMGAEWEGISEPRQEGMILSDFATPHKASYKGLVLQASRGQVKPT